MADYFHRIDLCPGCDGLRTARMDRLRGVTSITVTSTEGSVTMREPTAVYIGPVPEACPNPEGAGRG